MQFVIFKCFSKYIPITSYRRRKHSQFFAMQWILLIYLCLVSVSVFLARKFPLTSPKSCLKGNSWGTCADREWARRKTRLVNVLITLAISSQPAEGAKCYKQFWQAEHTKSNILASPNNVSWFTFVSYFVNKVRTNNKFTLNIINYAWLL